MCTFLNYHTYANGLRQNLQIRQSQGLGRKMHCTLVLEHKAKVPQIQASLTSYQTSFFSKCHTIMEQFTPGHCFGYLTLCI